jgi:hypothetical protein
MAEKIKNIFISHIHEDDSKLTGLKDLASRGGNTVRDGSITSEKPNDATNLEYIRYNILAPRIRWASTLVVLVSEGMRDSEHVNWEIEYAHHLGKRIVGVWDNGAKDSDLPGDLDIHADAVVGWQSDRVADAISGEINNWETSSGGARPERNIPRYNCKSGRVE